MVIVLNGPLSKVTALIKQMDCFIANDSSLMHVATAVGVPTVGIFGPTNHVRTSPFSPKGAIVCSGQKIEKEYLLPGQKNENARGDTHSSAGVTAAAVVDEVKRQLQKYSIQ